MMPTLDLAGFSAPNSPNNIIRTRDLEYAHEFISQNIVPYKYKCIGNEWKRNDALFHNHANVGEVDLTYIHYGREVIVNTEELSGAYLLQMVNSGSCYITRDGQTVENTGFNWTVVSPNSPFGMVWSEDCDLFEVKITQSFVEQVYFSLTGNTVKAPIKFEFELAKDGHFKGCMSSLFSYLCNEAEKTRGNRGFPKSSYSLKEFIVSMLLETQPHNYSSEIKSIDCCAPPCLKKAIDFMQENFDQVLPLSVIATAAGVSARSLSNAFRKYRSCSVMEYLKTIRLNKAREELLRSSPFKGRVTVVALNCGFTHAGRFASEYHQRFGEYPQETLRI